MLYARTLFFSFPDKVFLMSPKFSNALFNKTILLNIFSFLIKLSVLSSSTESTREVKYSNCNCILSLIELKVFSLRTGSENNLITPVLESSFALYSAISNPIKLSIVLLILSDSSIVKLSFIVLSLLSLENIILSILGFKSNISPL